MPSITSNAFFNAIPVTMPGRAIGRITSRDSELRPKKRYRDSPNARSVPRNRASPIASSPTWTLTPTACSAPPLLHASPHQCSVYDGGGQPNVFEELKELITTTASGA